MIVNQTTVTTTTNVNVVRPVIETKEEVITTTETKKIESFTPITSSNQTTERIETIVTEVHTPKQVIGGNLTETVI